MKAPRTTVTDESYVLCNSCRKFQHVNVNYSRQQYDVNALFRFCIVLWNDSTIPFYDCSVKMKCYHYTVVYCIIRRLGTLQWLDGWAHTKCMPAKQLQLQLLVSISFEPLVVCSNECTVKRSNHLLKWNKKDKMKLERLTLSCHIL